MLVAYAIFASDTSSVTLYLSRVSKVLRYLEHFSDLAYDWCPIWTTKIRCVCCVSTQLLSALIEGWYRILKECSAGKIKHHTSG